MLTHLNSGSLTGSGAWEAGEYLEGSFTCISGLLGAGLKF